MKMKVYIIKPGRLCSYHKKWQEPQSSLHVKANLYFLKSKRKLLPEPTKQLSTKECHELILSN